MRRINPGGDPAVWVAQDAAGDEAVCALALARQGGTPEIGVMLLSREEYTQKLIHDLAGKGFLYEQPTALLALGCLHPGDIALDIGAHVGFFTILFRLAVGASGRVFAFEPLAETYRRLLGNVIKNGFTNVLPLPLAVADQVGTADFHRDRSNDGGSSLLPHAGEVVGPVQVTCLDQLFRDDLPARPRLLKIDVEGVEMSVLQGGEKWIDRQPPDVVILEINRGALALGGATEWDLRRFFHKRGYRCAVINNGEGLDLGGGSLYRYLGQEEAAAPQDHRYVHNLMFVRPESGLYPAPFL